MKNAFLICAASSGAGKTTATLAILAALRARGLKTRSFKAGPDFIDPSHHRLATGLPSENLDPWMLSQEANRELFHRGASEADVCAVEGVMGLYDGIEGGSSTGSAAHLAKILKLPIVLVIDAKAMARSAAAMVYGFMNFEPGITLAGVIWNRVGSPKHRFILDEALASADLPPSLGAIPRTPEIAIPERHLGLVTPQDANLTDNFMKKLSQLGESCLNLDALLAATRLEQRIYPWAPPTPVPEKTRLKIGIPRDAAYCFYYEDALRRIEDIGETVFFSPIDGDGIPPNINGVYLGGGYPEAHAARISTNESFLSGLRMAHAKGMPIYGECGGFMTLCQGIEDDGGRTHPMAGIFPTWAKMRNRAVGLGYREVKIAKPGKLKNLCARGHEFHYSNIDEMPQEIERIYRVKNARGESLPDEGFMLGNTLGSYVHLHFASNPELPKLFFGR